ncbi:MAG TPA: hypothetical protein EYQ86_05710 [Bacteroidetes bacterium]|nr:hypothetical protein [Bacteroidota bacterium]
MKQFVQISFYIIIIFLSACVQKVPLNETVQKSAKIYYKSMPFNGVAFSRYANGNVYMEEEYENGIRSGEKRIWYLNGKQKLKEVYLDGKLNGEKIEWYENGIMKTKRTYLEGVETGKYYEWFENGKKKLEVDRKARTTFYNN